MGAGYRVLVVCHATYGQPRRVADRVAGVLRAAGAELRLTAPEDAPPPFRFDAVVVGDSIHDRGNKAALLAWLSEFRDVLAEMPTALFQVRLASRFPHHPTWGHVFVERLRSETGFDPQVVGEFGGALAYTSYGWRSKRGRPEGERTDWAAVDGFAHDFYGLIVEHSAVVPPRLSAPALSR